MPASRKVKKKLSDSLSDLIESSLRKRFVEAEKEIKDVIMERYDSELVDVVTDRESKTNPNLYREDFLNRLNEFSYIEGTTLRVPDMENFDFSGRLRVIQSIMEGLSGIYMEVNEEDYIAIFGKRPINEDPLDEYVSPKEKIYLVRYNAKLRRAEKDLNKKLVRYPFSNTPPIRVLDVADKYVNDNMDRWIKEAVGTAQKQFIKNFRGAHL